MNQIKYAPTTSLKPHPLNATIYGDGCDQELLDSIKEKGIVNPILVTKSFQIISGHRRFNAAQMAAINEVPVIIMEQDDPLEIEELLIVTNKQRNKTAEQIGREYKKLKEIKEAIKEKIRLANLQHVKETLDVVNLPHREEPGRSRDLAAKELGISASNAEHSEKVVEKIDSLRSEGKTEEAEALRQTLNQKSVNAAYQQIKPKKEPEKPVEYSDKWNRIYKENESLKAENEKLKEQNNEYQEAEKTFKERIDTLEKENANLLEEKAQAQKENKNEPDGSVGTTVPLIIHKKLAREKAILEEKLSAAKKKNPQVDTPQIGNEELKQEVERLKAEMAEIKKAPQAEIDTELYRLQAEEKNAEWLRQDLANMTADYFDLLEDYKLKTGKQYKPRKQAQ